MTTELKAALRAWIAADKARTQGPWVAISGDSYCAYPTVLRGDGPHFILYDCSDEEAATAEKDTRFPGMDADAHFIAIASTMSRPAAEALLVAIESHDMAIAGLSLGADGMESVAVRVTRQLENSLARMVSMFHNV